MFAILRRCFQIESCFKRQTKIPMQVQSAVEGKNLQQKNYAYFYLEEGASLSYTLSSQNKDGETVTLPGTLSGTQKGIANGKCYTLTFTFNPESRSLSVAD